MDSGWSWNTTNYIGRWCVPRKVLANETTRRPSIDPPRNAYFNYRLSRARMITEGAFVKLKGDLEYCFANVKVKRKLKIMGLDCVVLHNLCIDKEDIIPRKFDLSYDHVTNKRRDRAELRDKL